MRSGEAFGGHALEATSSTWHICAIAIPLMAKRGPSFAIESVRRTPAGSDARRRSYISVASTGQAGVPSCRARRVAPTICATVHLPTGRGVTVPSGPGTGIVAVAMSASGASGQAAPA